MSESDDIDAIRERKRRELQQRADGQSTSVASSPATPTEPVHVDSKAELTQLAADHQVVLADFYADWCGPCQMLEPTVREIAQNTPAAVAKVDVDALPGLAQEMRVQGVPSLFLYVDGEPVKRLVGVQDYGTLESLIEQYAG
jgi:thioredoxin 1